MLIAVAAVLPHTAAAQAVLTQDQALRLAFPEPARIERRTAFLSDAQLKAARRLAGPGIEIRSNVLTYYVALRNGTPLGVAYFDAHRVRTMSEVLMIVVSPAARVDRIEVLSFKEPPDYRAPDGWLDQIEGKGLGDKLSLKRGIVNMTGATLTSRAIVDASRRVLALHQEILPLQQARTAEP